MTTIQLFFVSLVLVSFNILKHYLYDLRVYSASHQHYLQVGSDLPPEQVMPSWVFGPHLGIKVKELFWLGFIFGLKLGVMNWGLSLLDLGSHFLLQASSLFWTVLFAWLLVGELPTLFEAFLCLNVIVGETLVTVDVHSSLEDLGIDGVLPIVLNLIPPLLLGLLLILLRRATNKLMAPEIGMTTWELTGIKLTISFLTVLPFALVLEGALVGMSDLFPSVTFWAAWSSASKWIPWILVSSITLTLIFQTTLTSLSAVAGAITVGVASEVKVVAQVLILAIIPGKFHQGFSGTWIHVAGTVLVLGSAAAFSIARYIRLKDKHINHKLPHLYIQSENPPPPKPV